MIRRISHIGVLVRDLDAAVKLWTETLGFKLCKRFEIPVEGLRIALVSVGGTLDEMTIELLEPLDSSDLGNPVARRLERSGEGFYQIAIEDDDIEGAGERLAAKGLKVLERAPVNKKAEKRWLTHPKSTSGVMVELIAEAALGGGRRS